MPDLMSDAVNLMLVGMGFVFIFLTILVFVTSTMSKLAMRYAPIAKPAPVTLNTGTKANNDVNHLTESSLSRDARLVAVISAAVSKYRSQHKK